MADQAITALPVKTASGIANTDYLLGIDSAEGYQMLIKDLGDYIIQNVQSSLMGSNQTLAAALTALNSNTSHFVLYNVTANTSTNVPVGNPAFVFVTESDGAYAIANCSGTTIDYIKNTLVNNSLSNLNNGVLTVTNARDWPCRVWVLHI